MDWPQKLFWFDGVSLLVQILIEKFGEYLSDFDGCEEEDEGKRE